MLGIPKPEDAPPTPQRPLSPMGEACQRMDLTAIHQILVMTHYRDDEGTNEVLLIIAKQTTRSKLCLQLSLNLNLSSVSLCLCSAIFPRVDTTNERYA